MTAAVLLGRGTGARATGGLGSASAEPRRSERQEDAGVAGGWGRRDGVDPAYRENTQKTQLVVCASDVRQGKSEQPGRARYMPSRERVPSRKECKGANARQPQHTTG